MFNNVLGGHSMSYVIIYQKMDTGWGAYSPDLPGLVAESETLEDVKELMHETMRQHLDGARTESDPILAPGTIMEYVTLDQHA
jgi:predicted RNase H-like HicB family nuclease